MQRVEALRSTPFKGEFKSHVERSTFTLAWSNLARARVIGSSVGVGVVDGGADGFVAGKTKKFYREQVQNQDPIEE